MPLQDLSDTAHFSPEAPVALPKAAVGERQVVAEPGPTRTSIYHRSQQICEWHKSTRSRPSVSLCERHQRAPKRPHAARSASLEAAYSCSLPLILTKDQVVHIRRTGCRSIRDSRWLLCVCVCVCREASGFYVKNTLLVEAGNAAAGRPTHNFVSRPTPCSRHHNANVNT